MIISLTLNPSIDFIVHTDELKVNKLNRVSAAVCTAGSKGINVSKTLAVYGEENVCCAVLAGKGGRDFDEYLRADLAKGVTRDPAHSRAATASARPYRKSETSCYNSQTGLVKLDYLWIENGETRTNVKVMDKNADMTEINGPGPQISETELDALMAKLQGYAKPGNIFALGGSIIPGAPKDIYKRIIEMAHEHGALAVLDADGESLKQGLLASPDFLKPNRYELGLHFGRDLTNASPEEVVTLGREMLGDGKMICVSDGSNGAIFITKDRAAQVPVIPVEVRSCCGAGDSVVTGMIYGYEHGYTFEDTLRISIATSTGAVTTEGTEPAAKDYIELLKKQVVINEI